jgi:hypothetical protein
MVRRLSSLGCFVLCCLLMFSSQAVRAEKQSWEQIFQSQVHQWMEEIIQHDGQFRDWRKAGVEVQTLGANQHQWLVSLNKAGKQVGYLIVAESPQQGDSPSPSFVLLEYGVGEYILFDDAFAPREIAAEPVYDGFASFWRVAHHPSQQLIDAKTGETFPQTARPDEPVMNTVLAENLAGSGQSLTQMRLFDDAQTDPFDDIGWLQDLHKPKDEVSWEQLMQKHDNTHITLTVSLYQNEVFAPFAVNSLHLWNDRAAYVGVWDGGLRFLPFAYAERVGDFHVN